MQINSQHILEILFKRTSYADTFRYIRIFKPKEIRFQDIFYNLDHILYSHTCCELFYITDFNYEHIVLFHLPIFPHQATPKLSELLYTDIVYTINYDAFPASYDIKYIKEVLRLDEQKPATRKTAAHKVKVYIHTLFSRLLEKIILLQNG